MKLIKGDSVEIVWQDATSESSWLNDGDIQSALDSIKPNITVGHYIMTYKDWVVIGMTRNPSGQEWKEWGFWKAVPKRWIIKINKLKNEKI